MVIRFYGVLLALFCACLGQVSAAEELSPERIVVEQTIQLSRVPIAVRVWLESRQVFQQQAVMVHIQARYAEPSQMPFLSVQAKESKEWTQPQLTPEAVLTSAADQQIAEWQLITFPKQVGVMTLPAIRLAFEGGSMARYWMTLPEMTLRVMPLPIYVPTEAIVGEVLDVQAQDTNTTWGLVGDNQQRQTHLVLANVMPKSIQLPEAQGEGIDPLSALVVQSDAQWQAQQLTTQVQLWQPWRLSASGRWHVREQDLWVFNPRTWQVNHLQLPALQGWAVPLWLWYMVQLFGIGVLLGVSYVVGRYVLCRIKRQHYRADIERTADAKQLYGLLIAHWHLRVDIPLAHQAIDLPIYPWLVALEDLLYSDDYLYNQAFVRIKREIALNSHCLPC